MKQSGVRYIFELRVAGPSVNYLSYPSPSRRACIDLNTLSQLSWLLWRTKTFRPTYLLIV